MKLTSLVKAFKLFTVDNGVALCRYVPTLLFGGGGPSSSTSVSTNVPDWLKDQTQGMIAGATKQLFDVNKKGDIIGVRPYTPYSANATDYYAGFSPMQQQSFAQAAQMQMPIQYAQATDFANAAGYGGLQSAQQALGYGNAGFQSGQLGQQFGLQSAQNAQNMAHAYGASGYEAGLQGQQSGLLGQQLGIQGGQYYGNMGAQSGQLGQQFGLQSAQNAQNMANAYGAMGAGYGAQAANLAGDAQYYGARGAGYGDLASQLGLQGLQAQQYGMDVGQQARNYAAQAAAAGRNYGNMVTNPALYTQYMSPYQQAVTDVAKQGALRDFQVAQQMRQSQAAKASAYGGARQAIENAEAQRNLNTQLQALQTQGAQNAYNQALANISQQQNLGLQGIQGAQQGLGTALQGGQLGLSGLAQAISGQNAAMQGQQVGLQGVDKQLTGTSQGMQGAGYGMQGVQGAQAGYGLANQTGQNLANIGNAQLNAQRDIINLQNALGAQQQAQEQKYIDAAIANYAGAQNAPMSGFNQLNSLIRGTGNTTTSYAPPPSMISQLGGLGMAGASMYGMMKGSKEGGVINKPVTYKSGGLVDIAIAQAMGDA